MSNGQRHIKLSNKQRNQVTTNYSNSFQVRITVIYSVKTYKLRNFIKPVFNATMLKSLQVGFHDFVALT